MPMPRAPAICRRCAATCLECPGGGGSRPEGAAYILAGRVGELAGPPRAARGWASRGVRRGSEPHLGLVAAQLQHLQVWVDEDVLGLEWGADRDRARAP